MPEFWHSLFENLFSLGLLGELLKVVTVLFLVNGIVSASANAVNSEAADDRLT